MTAPVRDVAAEIAAMHDELLGFGYQDIPEFGAIKPGARVHHSGQRWHEAQVEGTATVAHVMERSPSSWSATWGRRDIEVVVQRDKAMFPDWSPVAQWANYHTAPVVSS